MNCNCNSQKSCGCDFNIKTVGICDVSKLNFNGDNRSSLNWTEISVPEILAIPDLKPEIENIDQVYAKVILTSVKLIETPFAYRRYPLCFLPEGLLAEIQTLAGGLLAQFGVLDTALDVVLVPLNSILGLVGLPDEASEILQDLVDGLTDALDGVNDAIQALLAVLSTNQPVASVVCAALNTLEIALETLLGLVNTVVITVDNVIQLVDEELQAAIGAILALVTGGLDTVVDAVVTAINDILDPVLAIDCDPGYVYGLISNAEGTCLTGRKLIVEGVLKQKIVYTAEVEDQSVHSAHFEVPFIAFIIPYAKFENIDGPETFTVYDEQLDECREILGYQYPADITDVGLVPDLNEEFNVTSCIEDIYVKALEPKIVFKNVTVFLKATPSTTVLC